MDRRSTCCTQDTLDWEVVFMKPLKFKITFFCENLKDIVWIKKKNDYKTFWYAKLYDYLIRILSLDKSNWIEIENVLTIPQI